MTIQVAVQRGCYIAVYGEGGSILCNMATDTAAGDRLLGYTNSTVTVQRGSFVNTYDEHGSLVSSYGT